MRQILLDAEQLQSLSSTLRAELRPEDTLHPWEYAWVGDTGQMVVNTGKQLRLVSVSRQIGRKVTSKNPEQAAFMDMLESTDGPPVVACTALAGAGKTLIALAHALAGLESGRYDKVIITRPMTQAGGSSMAALPGTMQQKFLPYLQGFLNNAEFLLGEKKKGPSGPGRGKPPVISDVSPQEELLFKLQMMGVEVLPLAFARGASLNACLIVDEAQQLPWEDIFTWGTRVSERGRLILLGDLQQRDNKIALERSGLNWVMNQCKMAQNSALIGTCELVQCERGPVARLFHEMNEEHNRADR